MSDRFDAELKRALKESTGKSLEGWEFTPSMRQTVLKRIAQEEAEPSEPVPLKRPRLVSARPYIWVAAAAAAFVVAINMMGEIDRGREQAAKSDPAAPMAASAQPELMAAGAPESQPPGESDSANRSAGSMGAAPQGAVKSAAADHESRPESATAATESAQALVAPPVPAAPARLHLVLPEAGGVERKAPSTEEEGFGIAAVAAPAEPLSMVRIGANTAVRTRSSLQFRDAGGRLVWEQPLGEGAGPLVARGGQIVTTAGPELLIFDTAGRQVRSQTVGGADLLALSADGRVAVIAGSTLSVYEGGTLQFRVDGAAQIGLAFGPDGTLAAVLQQNDGHYLQLFGRDGSPLARAKLKGWGTGIAFADGGNVILVGGEAFHRSGQPLWQTPFPTQEVFALGSDGPVVARDAGQTISLLRPADGAEIWTAQHAGRQTLFVGNSDSGDLLAVVASLEDGAAVWVLDQAGGLRLSEHLPAPPSGVAVEGETLYLLMPEGVQTRALPPR